MGGTWQVTALQSKVICLLLANRQCWDLPRVCLGPDDGDRGTELDLWSRSWRARRISCQLLWGFFLWKGVTFESSRNLCRHCRGLMHIFTMNFSQNSSSSLSRQLYRWNIRVPTRCRTRSRPYSAAVIDIHYSGSSCRPRHRSCIHQVYAITGLSRVETSATFNHCRHSIGSFSLFVHPLLESFLGTWPCGWT